MKKRGILAVNLAVLLFGLAGLFAKWIRLPAIAITFGRVLFSSLLPAVCDLPGAAALPAEAGAAQRVHRPSDPDRRADHSSGVLP